MRAFLKPICLIMACLTLATVPGCGQQALEAYETAQVQATPEPTAQVT